MFVWCFLALLTLAPVATVTKPGIIFRLTQKALDFVRGTLIDNLEEILKKIKVPDIKRESFPLLECKITDKQISDLTKSEVKFVPNTGVTLSAEDVIVNLQGHLKCLWVDQDHTSTLKRVTFNISTTVKNKNGHPAVKITQCQIYLRGLSSNINRVFRVLIKGMIYLFGEGLICSMIKEQIREFNNMLATNVLTKVEKLNTEIDMMLVETPVIYSKSLDLLVKGVFYNIGQHKEPPSSPATFSLPQEADKMFYIGVSAFTINSFVFVHRDACVRKFDITDDMIPSGFPFRLSTTTFGAFIPNIADRYPDQMIKLSIRTDKTPVIKFQNNNAVVEASGTVTVYVIESNNNESPLFDLSLVASANIHLDVSEQKLTGAVILDRIGPEIKNNKLGQQFEVAKLKEFLENVIKQFMIPIINAHLQKDYSLPLPLFPLPSSIGTIEPVNTQVQVLNDYLLIGTDIKFTVQP